MESFHEFELDTANRVLRKAGEPVALPAKAFDVLCFLFENRGRLVGKNEIIDAVWAGQAVEEANLTVQISQIRKALGDDPRSPKLIVTVPRFGYRFNPAEAQPPVVVETFERVTIEHEETAFSRRPAFLLAAGALAALVLVAAFALIYFGNRPGGGSHFGPLRITRLTNNGRVGVSSMSRDAKFLAYSLSEPAGTSLWVRQVGVANDRRIVEPQPGEIWSVAFDPSGTEILFVTFSSDRVDPVLRRIPVFGGPSTVVADTYPHSVTFSPDGSRIAYVLPNSAANENYLIVQKLDGSEKRVVASKPQPSTFVYDGHYASWNPDGRSIAAVVNRFEAGSNHNSIVSFDPETGGEAPIGDQRWFDVRSIEWTSDGDGLLVSASRAPAEPNRIWFQPRNGSEPMAMTDDLNEYDSLASGGAPRSFTARQNTSTASVSTVAGESGPVRIHSEVGIAAPVRWTRSGKIVFRSVADGSANLWIADADGSGRRQLTTDAAVDERGLCVTPDERYAVFVSRRSGWSALWRLRLDGSGLEKLTDGGADAFPNCTPDGEFVIFQRGLLSQPALWKVPVGGGEPIRLTERRAKWGSVSPDGRTVAFLEMVDDRWRIGFVGADGTRIDRSLAAPELLRGNRLVWSADGKSIFFSAVKGESGELWKIPADGGTPVRVSEFRDGHVADFDLDRSDGIVVTTQRTTSDIVGFALR